MPLPILAAAGSFLSGKGGKVLMYLIIIALIVSMIGGAFLHHNSVVGKLSEDNVALTNRVTKLSVAVDSYEKANESQRRAIGILQGELKANERIMRSYRVTISDHERRYDDLMNKTKGLEDAVISPRLLAILNSLNGAPDGIPEE